MSLMLSVTNAKLIGPGVWGVEMPPHQVRLFGEPALSQGHRSVILVSDFEFDNDHGLLKLDADAVLPLNVGTTPETIIVSSASTGRSNPLSSAPLQDSNTLYGRGDREFLRLCEAELTEDMAKTAEGLLAGVRSRASGDLKRGKSRNFSETPDNFWYVIVQPQINHLSLTVRGPVSHFQGHTTLELKDDRGNTRFKVTGEEDVKPALDLIFHAIRKR